MAWNRFRTDAIRVMDRVTLDKATWRDLTHSLRFWLFLSMTAVLITALLYQRYSRVTSDKAPWQDFVPEVKNADDSPFFAYLGHNILTEGCAKDPNNTSFHAISRIPKHIRSRHGVLNDMSEEPQDYGVDDDDDNDNDAAAAAATPSWQQYRGYTYPDTHNKHLRHDHVEQIYDQEHDRRWQRRTMHIYAI